MEICTHRRAGWSDVDFDNLGFGRIFSAICSSPLPEWGLAFSQNSTFGNIEIPPSLCSLITDRQFSRDSRPFGPDTADQPFFVRKNTRRKSGKPVQAADLYSTREQGTLYGRRRSWACLPELAGEWCTRNQGSYPTIRPFIFAADSFLGVHATDTYLFMVITSPVAAYYKEGLNPVKLLTSGEYVRAVKGAWGRPRRPRTMPRPFSCGKGPADGVHTSALARRDRKEVHRGSGHHEHHVPHRRRAHHPAP